MQSYTVGGCRGPPTKVDYLLYNLQIRLRAAHAKKIKKILAPLRHAAGSAPAEGIPHHSSSLLDLILPLGSGLITGGSFGYCAWFARAGLTEVTQETPSVLKVETKKLTDYNSQPQSYGLVLRHWVTQWNSVNNSNYNLCATRDNLYQQSWVQVI